MKEIIYISFSSSENKAEQKIEAFGETFSIIRYGANYNLTVVKELLKKFDGEASAIGLAGLPGATNFDGNLISHPVVEELKRICIHTPVTDGQLMREMYIPWLFKKIAENNKSYFSNKKIGFFCGTIQYNFMDDFLNISDKIYFADPYFIKGLPILLQSKKQLEMMLKVSLPFLTRLRLSQLEHRNFTKKKIQSTSGLKEFAECDIYVVNETQLQYIDTDLLDGKTLIIDSVSEISKNYLETKNIKEIITFNPTINGTPINFTLFSAMLRSLKEENVELDLDEVIPYMEKCSPANVNKKLGNTNETTKKFAFLIHPLQKSDLLKVKPIDKFKKIKGLAEIVEKLAQFAPGFVHGKIAGIKSENSPFNVEGLLYVVPMTPKMLLQADTENFYEKVREITEDARKKGCEIFGLGAYTKIVGDAGVSIAKRSKIPVTTGNSLSSASTLWAANYAVSEMGFVKNEDDIFQGKVMVIGATGSIGKVTAKLVSQRWKEVVLIAPRPFKLLELKEEIAKISPHANVIYSTNADKYANDMDLIITTTSNQGEKILSIEKVKPGAVICDVSRPFDISQEDALTRPDVLVIASGEVELPGNVSLNCDIGLHGSVVYACLAETALLALENRLESFSLSRSLSYEKVREIDQIARKHGVKLAAIMGHKDEITAQDIELCRKHALKKLNLPKT
jgi:predicted amino acid dehydrogenase